MSVLACKYVRSTSHLKFFFSRYSVEDLWCVARNVDAGYEEGISEDVSWGFRLSFRRFVAAMRAARLEGSGKHIREQGGRRQTSTPGWPAALGFALGFFVPSTMCGCMYVYAWPQVRDNSRFLLLYLISTRTF